MENLLIRILIAIGVIWLTQVLLDTFEIKEPAHKILFVVVIILAILFLVTGGSVHI
jgi:hypothetical protein